MEAEIQIELLKLLDGERRLRLSHASSGLCLEKRLEPESPVAAQKERWRCVLPRYWNVNWQLPDRRTRPASKLPLE